MNEQMLYSEKGYPAFVCICGNAGNPNVPVYDTVEIAESTFGEFAETMDQVSPRIQPDGNVQYIDEYRFDITGNAILPFLKKVACLTDEAKVILDKDGWHVKVVDPAHVAMFEVTLPCDRFWNYDKSLASQVVEIGLPIEDLERVFKKMGAKDRKNAITIDIIQEKNKIRILSGSSMIEYNLVDTENMSSPHVPKINLPANIMLESLEPLAKWFKVAREISDHVALILEPGKNMLHCIAEGETTKTETDIEGSLDYVRWSPNTGKVRSLFPLDYLENMVKAFEKEKVTVHIGQDYPLMIESRDSISKALLAPRIESD